MSPVLDRIFVSEDREPHPKHGRRRTAWFGSRADRAPTISAGAIGACLFVYIAIRAATMAFTADESLSYVWHARAELLDLLFYRVAYAPSNNHLLNSLLMRLTGMVFGESEFSLRSPNVLAGAVYLSVSLLFARMASGPARLMLFLAVVANPFLLDWFSLARGYGLGLASILLSMYAAVRAIQSSEYDLRLLWLSAASSLVAMLSMIPFVDYFLALLSTVSIVALYRWRAHALSGRRLVATIIPFVTVGIVYTCAMAGNIISLQNRGEFYYGGTRDYWNDTVQSLVTASFYGKQVPDYVRSGISLAIVAVLCLATISLIVSIVKNTFNEHVLLFVSWGVTTTLAIGTIAQHVFLGTKYLIDRTACLFIPLLALLLLALIVEHQSMPVRTLATLLAVAWAAAGLVQTASSVNFSYPLYVTYDAATPAMLADLSAIVDDEHLNTTRLRVGPGLTWTTNFYRVTRHLDWLDPVEEIKPGETADFYFYGPRDGRLFPNDQRVVRVYTVNGNRLAIP